MSVYPSALPTVRPAVRSAFEQGSGGGAASIIAGLFAQGQQGFWLPFTNFASLSQDSAGTLPYTALEQPVGRVLDRSGRGNHASQVTSTARGVVSALVVSPPTRPYYLQLDGVDDFYTCGGGGSTTGFYYSDVIRRGSIPAGFQGLIGDFSLVVGVNAGFLLQLSASGMLELALGTGATFTKIVLPIPVSQKVFIAAWDNGVSVFLQVADAVTSVARPPAMLGGSSIITIGRMGYSGTNYFNGQITEPIYRAGPPPSAHERSVIRGYQMQKAGL